MKRPHAFCFILYLLITPTDGQFAEIASLATSLLGGALGGGALPGLAGLAGSAGSAAAGAGGLAGAVGQIGQLYQLAQGALQLTGTGVGVLNKASEGNWFPAAIEQSNRNNANLQSQLAGGGGLGAGGLGGGLGGGGLGQNMLGGLGGGLPGVIPGGGMNLGPLGPRPGANTGNGIGTEFGTSFPAPSIDDYDTKNEINTPPTPPDGLVGINARETTTEDYDFDSTTVATTRYTTEEAVTLFPDEIETNEVTPKRQIRIELPNAGGKETEDYIDQVTREEGAEVKVTNKIKHDEDENLLFPIHQKVPTIETNVDKKPMSVPHLTKLIESLRNSNLSENEIRDIVAQVQGNERVEAPSKIDFSSSVQNIGEKEVNHRDRILRANREFNRQLETRQAIANNRALETQVNQWRQVPDLVATAQPQPAPTAGQTPSTYHYSILPGAHSATGATVGTAVPAATQQQQLALADHKQELVMVVPRQFPTPLQPTISPQEAARTQPPQFITQQQAMQYYQAQAQAQARTQQLAQLQTAQGTQTQQVTKEEQNRHQSLLEHQKKVEEYYQKQKDYLKQKEAYEQYYRYYYGTVPPPNGQPQQAQVNQGQTQLTQQVQHVQQQVQQQRPQQPVQQQIYQPGQQQAYQQQIQHVQQGQHPVQQQIQQPAVQQQIVNRGQALPQATQLQAQNQQVQTLQQLAQTQHYQAQQQYQALRQTQPLAQAHSQTIVQAPQALQASHLQAPPLAPQATVGQQPYQQPTANRPQATVTPQQAQHPTVTQQQATAQTVARAQATMQPIAIPQQHQQVVNQGQAQQPAQQQIFKATITPSAQSVPQAASAQQRPPVAVQQVQQKASPQAAPQPQLQARPQPAQVPAQAQAQTNQQPQQRPPPLVPHVQLPQVQQRPGVAPNAQQFVGPQQQFQQQRTQAPAVAQQQTYPQQYQYYYQQNRAQQGAQAQQQIGQIPTRSPSLQPVAPQIGVAQTSAIGQAPNAQYQQQIAANTVVAPNQQYNYQQNPQKRAIAAQPVQQQAAQQQQYYYYPQQQQQQQYYQQQQYNQQQYNQQQQYYAQQQQAAQQQQYNLRTTQLVTPSPAVPPRFWARTAQTLQLTTPSPQPTQARPSTVATANAAKTLKITQKRKIVSHDTGSSTSEKSLKIVDRMLNETGSTVHRKIRHKPTAAIAKSEIAKSEIAKSSTVASNTKQ